MTDDETVNHGPIIIQRHGALEVAVIYGDGKEQRAANASLIAAAPELLEALKALEDHVVRLQELGVNRGIAYEDDESEVMETVRAAIAKAEGTNL